MNWSGKRMVIFGCGYLGTRVALQALERGMEVIALTRNAGQATELNRLGVHRVVVAELDSEDWHPLIEPRQDLILNCVSSGGGGWDGYRKSYLEGMRSVLKWAGTGEIGTCVFTSSTSVYGQGNEQWVTEGDPAEGSSEGGRILREAEALLEEVRAAVGRWFVLRLGGIYGPGRHHLLARALGEFSEEEGDNVFLNSIHVDDAVGAFWAAGQVDGPGAGGVFNIVDDEPVRKGEIVRYLHELAKERGLVRSGVEPSMVSGRRGGLRPSRRISNEAARLILGWRPEYPNFRVGYEPLLAGLEQEQER